MQLFMCCKELRKERRGRKKEKGWNKERQSWTGLVPGSSGLRDFTSYSWLPSKPIYPEFDCLILKELCSARHGAMLLKEFYESISV